MANPPPEIVAVITSIGGFTVPVMLATLAVTIESIASCIHASLGQLTQIIGVHILPHASLESDVLASLEQLARWRAACCETQNESYHRYGFAIFVDFIA